MSPTPVRWYREREAWAFVGRRYLPWLAGLNLVWETLQLPLYTIGAEGSAGAIAFAVFHCTLGDVLIGLCSLVLALVLAGEGALARWRWWRIAALMLLLGPAYTIFSEWLNTTLLRWGYSDLMPTLRFGGIEIGLSPVLQWLILPPLALSMARRNPDRSR